jgi:DNA-binding GntR family transcriptional regulator
MESIKEILMTRDGLTKSEANARIAEAKLDLAEALANGDIEYAEDICAEHFGLEPDYIFDLL